MPFVDWKPTPYLGIEIQLGGFRIRARRSGKGNNAPEPKPLGLESMTPYKPTLQTPLAILTELVACFLV